MIKPGDLVAYEFYYALVLEIKHYMHSSDYRVMWLNYPGTVSSNIEWVHSRHLYKVQ